jgi:hypothetical protein
MKWPAVTTAAAEAAAAADILLLSDGCSSRWQQASQAAALLAQAAGVLSHCHNGRQLSRGVDLEICFEAQGASHTAAATRACGLVHWFPTAVASS